MRLVIRFESWALFLLVLSSSGLGSKAARQPRSQEEATHVDRPSRLFRISQGQRWTSIRPKTLLFSLQDSVDPFPALGVFFSPTARLDHSYVLGNCLVTVLSSKCLHSAIPERAHCLILGRTVHNILPMLLATLPGLFFDLRSIADQRVSAFYIDTCLQRITLVSVTEPMFVVIPEELVLTSAVSELAIFLDPPRYELTARGVWRVSDAYYAVKLVSAPGKPVTLQGSLKSGNMTILSAAVAFKIDMPTFLNLPSVSNINLDNIVLKAPRVFAQVDRTTGQHEILFRSETTLQEKNINVGILFKGDARRSDMGILIELDQFSPRQVLLNLVQADASNLVFVPDNNQTMAIFLSSGYMNRFSRHLSSHGVSRWVQMSSSFWPGVTLLASLRLRGETSLDVRMYLGENSIQLQVPKDQILDVETFANVSHVRQFIALNSTSPMAKENLNRIKIIEMQYFYSNGSFLAKTESFSPPEHELSLVFEHARPSPALILRDFLLETS